MNLYIFDLDGTLRVTKSGKPCPNEPEDQELLPGIYEKIKHLYDSGCPMFFCTNQRGVEFGYMTKEQCSKIQIYLQIDLLKNMLCGGEIATESKYAKPNPYMACSIMKKCVDLFGQIEQVVMVGNAYTDKEFAKNAGISFYWAHDFFQWIGGFVVEDEHGFSPKEWHKKWKQHKELSKQK